MKVRTKIVKPFNAGCGVRRAGATYLVSNMQKYLETYKYSYFLFDPPVVINPAEWGVCPQGLSFVFNQGYWHVMDWIGATHYPNAADILEEAYEHGGSTLTPLKQDLQKLTPGYSRRLLIHPRGHVVDPTYLKENRLPLERIPLCFLEEEDYRRDMHINNPLDMCAALHWQGIISKVDTRDLVERSIGDTTYKAISLPNSVELKYEPAIIGWLPIDEIHLVDSPDKDEINEALKFLSDYTSLPTYLTNA